MRLPCTLTGQHVHEINVPLHPTFIVKRELTVGVYIFMPPTLKKLVGHIALGLSVYPCVRVSAPLFS